MLEKLFQISIILVLLISCFQCNHITASLPSIQLDSTFLETNVIAEDLFIPWDIAWGPDDWIWCTEQKNKIIRINPETKEIIPVSIIQKDFFPSQFLGVQGLALYKDSNNQILVYLTYLYKDSIQEENGYLKLTRFEYNETKNELINPLEIVDSIGTQKSYIPGGRMLIGKDQKLYLCTADEHALDSLSQKPTSLSGKVLRYNLDGSIPTHNPNPNSPIYALGYRNPQGITQTNTGDIITFCHGTHIDDELNLLKPNSNYGWPLINGICDTEIEKAHCENQHFKNPIKAWTPTIAPGSMAYYNHTNIPEWQNSLILLTLKEGDLRVLPIPQDIEQIASIEETVHLDQQYGRLRDICIAPNGNIYVLTCNTIPSDHQFARPEMKEKKAYDIIIEIKKGIAPTQANNSRSTKYYLLILLACLSLIALFLFSKRNKA